MTDLRPLPKPAPQGDILRFIFEKGGGLTTKGGGETERQTTRFENKTTKRCGKKIKDAKMVKKHKEGTETVRKQRRHIQDRGREGVRERGCGKEQHERKEESVK